MATDEVLGWCCFVFGLALMLAMLIATRTAEADGSEQNTPLDDW